MNEPIASLSPWLEIVLSEGGLPTLMPRWWDLEDSHLPFCLLNDRGQENPRGPAENAFSTRTLVLIHVYEPENLDHLLFRLARSQFPFDLVITTDTSEKARRIESLHLSIFGRSSQLQVEMVPNHGRDVLPFWRMLEKYGDHYDWFLKLHLKRSVHWEKLGYWNAVTEGKDAGSAWNDDCFDCLIPSSEAEWISLLGWMTDHRIGALYPRPHKIVEGYGWGHEQNMLLVAQILGAFGFDSLALMRPLLFPAGNMFWGAMKSFVPLTSFFLDPGHYPLEPVALDGTFLHAVERCYSYLLAPAGDAVGFLFPSQIGTPTSSLRGLEVSKLMNVAGSCPEPEHLSETLVLHRLYTAPAVEWRERTNRGQRELKSLREVIRSMEGSRLRKSVSRLRRLFRDH